MIGTATKHSVLARGSTLELFAGDATRLGR